MLVSRILGDKLSQLFLDVEGDVRIGPFIDCDACGRVLYEHVADPFRDPRTLDDPSHSLGDVKQLRATFGSDLNSLPAHVIRVVWERLIGVLRQLRYSKFAHRYGDPQCPRKRQ